MFRISLSWIVWFCFDRCTVQKADNPSAEPFCIELNVANRKELLFAMSDLDREEWIDAIRKYCTQSNIENTYLKSSKLGAGTHRTTTIVRVRLARLHRRVRVPQILCTSERGHIIALACPTPEPAALSHPHWANGHPPRLPATTAGSVYS